MAIEVMTTVLAKPMSTTRTRPTATDIPYERALQDEYSARVPLRDDIVGDNQNKNKFSAAASKQMNNTHCPTRAQS